MTNIYVAKYDENGQNYWGLFYENDKGILTQLTENFKTLSFIDEIDAQAIVSSCNLIRP